MSIGAGIASGYVCISVCLSNLYILTTEAFRGYGRMRADSAVCALKYSTSATPGCPRGRGAGVRAARARAILNCLVTYNSF